MGTRAERFIRRWQMFACLLPVLLVSAPLATHIGILDFRIGLLVMAGSIVLSALVLAGTLLMLCIGHLRVHASRLVTVAAIVAVPVVIGARIVVPSLHLPVIHDISTDIADPPQFLAAPTLRGPGSNPLRRDTELDAAQRAGYPGLAGIDTDLAPAAAYARALDTARALHWDVHFTAPERGQIEASETTFWFGFVDDVVIRVRPDTHGSHIDLRSVSRVGKGDLGANAKRIERFRRAFLAEP